MLAFPFRVLPNGRVAQVEDDTDEAAAQEIALLMLTRPGERPLVPGYGLPDPTYQTAQLSDADLIAAISVFGPDVTVTDVDQRISADGTAALDIRFTR